jgi:hypothetical protein
MTDDRMTRKMKRLDDRVQSDLRDLEYPALLLTKTTVRVYPDPGSLTAAWKKAVDRKHFDNALLVDSSGRARRIRTVRVLGSIGPFFGYDLFGNRSLRVAYEFAGDWEDADLDGIRSRVVPHWRRPDIGDVDSRYATAYERQLRDAPDSRSLIEALAEQYSAKFERTR